jgi:hypothetical protein
MTIETLIDRRTQPERPMDRWPAHIIRKNDLDNMIERLLLGSCGPDGRREAFIPHPKSVAPGFGLAPGIAVSIGVLAPDEATVSRRQNASTYAFAIEGEACVTIGDRELDVVQYDCWIAPSMQPVVVKNHGNKPFVYFEYSNSPVLQAL